MKITINAHWDCAQQTLLAIYNKFDGDVEVELIFNTRPVVCFCSPAPKQPERKKTIKELYNEDEPILFKKGQNQ